MAEWSRLRAWDPRVLGSNPTLSKKSVDFRTRGFVIGPVP